MVVQREKLYAVPLSPPNSAYEMNIANSVPAVNISSQSCADINGIQHVSRVLTNVKLFENVFCVFRTILF